MAASGRRPRPSPAWVVVRYVDSPIGERYQLGANDAPLDRPGRRGRGWVVVSRPMTKRQAVRIAATLNDGEAALHHTKKEA